ncbi:MAG TPA: hypothetical protein VFF73_14440 [Planctomycetota bacterium]|nr:hypothetical protein [Planctomycetota bacterium]
MVKLTLLSFILSAAALAFSVAAWAQVHDRSAPIVFTPPPAAIVVGGRDTRGLAPGTQVKFVGADGPVSVSVEGQIAILRGALLELRDQVAALSSKVETKVPR